jgi:hypothetical protein
MATENINTKPLAIEIISPGGKIFTSRSEFLPPLVIKDIIATGIIPAPGDFEEMKNRECEFEILPDHGPMIAKISEESNIRITGEFKKGNEILFHTKHGGIVLVNYQDNFTQVIFTLQDVENLSEKK